MEVGTQHASDRNFRNKCIYSSSSFFIWRYCKQKRPSAHSSSPTALNLIISVLHQTACSHLHVQYLEKRNYQFSSHFKAWRDLVQCSQQVVPEKFTRPMPALPSPPTLPGVAPQHGGRHAAPLPAAPHTPVLNEVLSKKFPHTSTESLLHLLTFLACCNLQCLIKTNRNILPPEHNLSEDNSFMTGLNEFQGTMGFLEGRKNYSIIPHTTTTTSFALHMLTPEAGATINNQPICPICFPNRVKFYHTCHTVQFLGSLASQLLCNSLSSTTYT